MALKNIVEIKGIAFPNKGAELLLVACLNEIEARGMHAAVEPYSPYSYKLRYPLYTKTRIHRLGMNVLAPAGWLPKYVRDRLGFVRSSELSLSIDASGFAYGDPWPTSLAEQRVTGERLGCPLVMLPQSWGEFRSRKQLRSAKKISDRASLIFAREDKGASYFEAATGVTPKVVPDISYSVQVKKLDMKHDIVIIPNFQVLDREGPSYLDKLSDIIELLDKVGRRVTLLNHEGPKDLEICKELRLKFSGKNIHLPIIEPATGIDAKAVIGCANFVISSRYHGLVAALSQARPCCPLGWSYKYQSAMEEFDFTHEQFSKLDSASVVQLALSQKYCAIFASEQFAQNLAEIRRRIALMWDDVFGLLGKQ